jgi:tetratricopeptide (TPR) repeat protein
LDAAAALVADILNKDGRNTAGLAIRAGIRIERGQFEGAISDLRQALNDQPRAANLMLLLATAYEREGSTDLAEKEFADAMAVSNYNPVVSLNYVAFLQRRGSTALAEDVLTDLASRWPKNVNVLSALAQVRLARQEWVGAQQVAEVIKHLGADQSVGNELLGAALAGSNKLDESIDAFQNAYAEAPASAQPMSALVSAYVRAGKADQAVAFLQSVLTANPSNAEAYVLLGSVQLANKTPDQARQSFMTAIDKDPTSFIGYNALANFYLTQNNTDGALKTARDGLEKIPESFDLHMTLATILERTGDYAGAITEYEHLHGKDPGSLVVNNNLASLLADHRTDAPSLDEAKALAAALNKSPLPQFKDTVGWVSYRQGDYQTALPLLEAAAAALPNLALVRYHLGMTYAALSQPGKAAEQFNAALNDAPGHDLEQEIRTALTKNSTQ